MKVYLMRVEYSNARRRWAICSEGNRDNPGRLLIGGDDTTKADIIRRFERGIGTIATSIITLSGVHSTTEVATTAAGITHAE